MERSCINSGPVDHNRQTKAAVINDFSGFGRCSLTAMLPVLSAMKVQCCPVPTAVFTNHTGFSSFSCFDCSQNLSSYIRDWKETGLQFSAIASGFLSSVEQIDFVENFVSEFRSGGTMVLVDPVMGDRGRLYRSFSGRVAASMRRLLSVADVLTPNLTEACLLSQSAYSDDLADGEIASLARRLCDSHARACVISGVPRGRKMLNFVYSRENGDSVVESERIGEDRSGTGDVFSAVILGELLNGNTFERSVERAASFITASIRRAEELEIAHTDGLPFEETLPMLWS